MTHRTDRPQYLSPHPPTTCGPSWAAPHLGRLDKLLGGQAVSREARLTRLRTQGMQEDRRRWAGLPPGTAPTTEHHPCPWPWILPQSRTHVKQALQALELRLKQGHVAADTGVVLQRWGVACQVGAVALRAGPAVAAAAAAASPASATLSHCGRAGSGRGLALSSPLPPASSSFLFLYLPHCGPAVMAGKGASSSPSSLGCQQTFRRRRGARRTARCAPGPEEVRNNHNGSGAGEGTGKPQRQWHRCEHASGGLLAAVGSRMDTLRMGGRR